MTPKESINSPRANKLSALLLLWFTITLCACSKDEPIVITNPPSTERGHLVSYSKTGSMTADEVVADSADEGDISAYTNHDLDIYSIVYNSLEGGNPLEVSGLVIQILLINEMSSRFLHFRTQVRKCKEKGSPKQGRKR